MKTGKLLVMNLLVAAVSSGCSNMEEPVTDGTGQVIEASAGIAQTTRAVIAGGYANSLDVSFARMDNPGTAVGWTAIDAVRAGGAGNTVLTFEPEQTYLTKEGESILIGYYPRKELDSETDNPASVSYILTGNEDIMATGVQAGSLVDKFNAFIFSHLLTQLQFRCIGTTEAIGKWTEVTSIKVKNIHNTLVLSLDKTTGAVLTAAGAADQTLSVKDCPSAVSTPDAANPPTGYLLLYPATDMGTESLPIYLEVEGMYDGTSRTLDVIVSNIDGGVKKEYSHLLTLTFTEDGKIAVEAGITEWQPGNGGSTIITPGE